MIIQVWSFEIVAGKGAEATELCKKLAAAHTKNGVPSRAIRPGTGNPSELKRMILTMEFETLAATEAYKDKGEEVDALHQEAKEYVVEGSMAYQYYRTLE